MLAHLRTYTGKLWLIGLFLLMGAACNSRKETGPSLEPIALPQNAQAHFRAEGCVRCHFGPPEQEHFIGQACRDCHTSDDRTMLGLSENGINALADDLGCVLQYQEMQKSNPAADRVKSFGRTGCTQCHVPGGSKLTRRGTKFDKAGLGCGRCVQTVRQEGE